jgi:hypothetical protein
VSRDVTFLRHEGLPQRLEHHHRLEGEHCLKRIVQLGYLEVTVQEKLRSAWPGPFVKVERCCDQPFVYFQCEQTSQVQS